MKPYLLIEWNDTETDAIGWLCIFNLVKGYAGGGIRMHPSVTREMVIRLAEIMAYKRKASECVRKGGCKAGIIYDYKSPDAYDVLKRFITAMRPYIDIGLNMGSDLGTREDDVRQIFKELGMKEPLTKSMKKDPVVAKGLETLETMLQSTYNGLPLNDVVTGFGTAFSADEGWKQLKGDPGASVVVQGFGCVGLSCCRKMADLGYKVVGVADANCFVYCKDGLDVDSLIDNVMPRGEMNQSKFDPSWQVMPNTAWIEVPCDIFIPAAIADVITDNNANQFKAKLISEGANIPVDPKADPILHKKSVHVVPDFVANIGAIRFFYVTTFGLIDATPEAVIDDIEALCRKNAANLFKKSAQTGTYERDLAFELFEPTIQDPPEC